MTHHLIAAAWLNTEDHRENRALLTAVECFRIVAPNVAPSEIDLKYIHRLAQEYMQYDLQLIEVTPITNEPDDECNAHDVKLLGQIIATIWIENNSTPNAFFYWEA